MLEFILELIALIGGFALTLLFFTAIGALFYGIGKLLDYCYERYREIKAKRISGQYCIDISKCNGRKAEYHNHKTALIDLDTTGFYPSWKFLEIDGEPVKHEDWEGFRHFKEKLEDFDDSENQMRNWEIGHTLMYEVDSLIRKKMS